MRLELVSVSFENYKSFKERAELNLNRINYLIGPNGAGKSNVFAGIKSIFAMVANGEQPDPDDCFDGMCEAPTTLSFTTKLSKDERHGLMKEMHGYGGTVSPTSQSFQFLKYEASFLNSQRIRQKLLLSGFDGELTPMQDLSFKDGEYRLDRCDIESLDLKAEYNRYEETRSSDMSPKEFLDLFDADVSALAIDLFSSLRLVEERKKIPDRAPVGEDHGVSSDGENLPNQLMTLFNDRAQIQKFGSKIMRLSSGEIVGIDSKLREKDARIQFQEKWRTKPTPTSEISSGYHQQVILLSCLDRFKESIVMIDEPELHLHATAQKNLLDFIRNDLPSKQVIITTHSPIFVNVSETESTFLLSKNAEGTAAVPISESNVHLIRLNMGISHEDAFDGSYLCCVEGISEKIAIPALARKLGYRVGLSPWMLDLKGYGNSKHLEPLLEYLGMSEKKFFVLLDKNGQAREHMDRLLGKGLLTEGQCHFLGGNFEDLFPSAVLAEYSGQLAQKHGVAFGLSEDDLDRRRQDGSVTDVLEEEWRKQSSGRKYPKAELADLLASEPGDVPDEAAAVVRRIMDGLGVELGSGSAP